MGKKSAPQPFIQPTTSIPDQVDRKELDKETTAAVEKAKVARASTKDGAAAPQASLLAERDFWKKKESLLKK
jgi:hypothetical protein